MTVQSQSHLNTLQHSDQFQRDAPVAHDHNASAARQLEPVLQLLNALRIAQREHVGVVRDEAGPGARADADFIKGHAAPIGEAELVRSEAQGGGDSLKHANVRIGKVHERLGLDLELLNVLGQLDDVPDSLGSRQEAGKMYTCLDLRGTSRMNNRDCS